MSAVAEQCDPGPLDRAQQLNHDHHWVLKIAHARLDLFRIFGVRQDLNEALTLIEQAINDSPARAIEAYHHRHADERAADAQSFELPEDFVLVTHAERIVDEADLLPL